MPDGCSVKNMKVSGNDASYTMECTKDPKMKADVKMTFQGDGFTMKQDILMDRGGQQMPMQTTMTGKYKGPLQVTPEVPARRGLPLSPPPSPDRAHPGPRWW
jgi:hypothetical protein